MAEAPTVCSIVVPTFNRARMLEMNICSLLAQDFNDPYEILVIDNNSTDDTRSRVQALSSGDPSGRLRYVFAKEQGVSAARNAGVAAARGEVIAFIDDDAVAGRGWLRALTDVHRRYPDAWCVGGKIVLQLPDALPKWFSVRSQSLRSHLSALDRGDTIVAVDPWDIGGANFSVRRRVFDHVGLFDPSLGVAGSRRLECDEVELCWRIRNAGGKLYYYGGAVVTHLVPPARLTRGFFRTRALWRGRTSRLLDGMGQFRIGPCHLAIAGLRVALNRIGSWTRISHATEARMFETELEFWNRLGYLQQTMMMTYQTRGARRWVRSQP